MVRVRSGISRKVTDDITNFFGAFADSDGAQQAFEDYIALNSGKEHWESMAEFAERYFDISNEWMRQFEDYDSERYVHPEDRPVSGFKIGCAWKGVLSFKEYEDEHIFIPTSDYCLPKVINKAIDLGLIDSENKLPHVDSQFGITLDKFRAHCKKYNVCGDDVNKLPKIYKVNEKKDDKKKIEILDPNGRSKTDAAIFLLRTKSNLYHAILIKNKYWKTCETDKKDNLSKKLEYITDKIRFEPFKTLTNTSIRVREFKPKPVTNFVYCFDIETYVSKEENGERLHPYAIGYLKLDISTEQMDIKPENVKIVYGVDCIDKFINTINLENNPDERTTTIMKGDKLIDECETLNIFLYSHNGAGFDTRFIKQAINVKFISEISTGSKIKELTISHNDFNKNVFHFRDSMAYISMSLDKACKSFGVRFPKMKFDIVGKSLQWYEENNVATNSQVLKRNNWYRYLQYDILSMSEVVFKFNSMIWNNYGFQITHNLGNPGLALNLCKKSCPLLKSARILKDHATNDFIRSACYGGRVVVYKQSYDSDNCPEEHKGGLISLDANSLYPSAMSIADFPLGDPEVFNEGEITVDELEALIREDKKLIAEVTIDAGNHRYPIHPYKTEEGCLIYKSGIFSGVYTSVELQDMLWDGYQIDKVSRAIVWPSSGKIFSTLIKNLYDARKKYKREGNTMQEVIKLILNSMYGKFLQRVDTQTYYSKEPKQGDDIMSCTDMGNGQYLIKSKTENETATLPAQIGAFILSYSRRLMNNIIRRVRPENVYYGDTDSISIPLAILKSSDIIEDDDLCGFKNDYGDSSIILKAIFLDLKRYCLVVKNNDKITLKTKFNGLSFKNISNNSLENFLITEYDISLPPDEDKPEQVEITDEYDTLETPLEYAEDETPAQIKERKHKEAHAKLKSVEVGKLLDDLPNAEIIETYFTNRDKGLLKMYEWHAANPDKINQSIAIECDFWKRCHNDVYISKREYAFQVSPSKRGNFKDGEWFPFGYDETKPPKRISFRPIDLARDKSLRRPYSIGDNGFYSNLPLLVDASPREVTEIPVNDDIKKILGDLNGFIITDDGRLLRCEQNKFYCIDTFGKKRETPEAYPISIVTGVSNRLGINFCTETIDISEHRFIIQTLRKKLAELLKTKEGAD